MYEAKKVKKETMPFFTVNSLICVNDNNIYIWKTDRSSKELFVKLCSLKVEVKGFVEIQPQNEKFFHKPVVSYESIKEDEIIITLEEKEAMCFAKVNYCNPICMNSAVKDSKVVIYGAGTIGRRIKNYLEKQNIKVACFIDAKKELVGSAIEGVPIYEKDSLKYMEDVLIIESGRYWKEIEKAICEITPNHKRCFVENSFFLDVLEDSSKIIIDANLEKVFSVNHILIQLEEHFADKDMIIYENDVTLACKYKKVLEILGYHNISIATDAKMIMVNADSKLWNIQECIKSIRNNNAIILAGTEEKGNYLLEQGLIEGEEFTSLFYPSVDYFFKKKMKLDVLLGYTYNFSTKNLKYEGYYLYGQDRKDDYRILVLGGSNTETNRAVFPCWVEILFYTFLSKRNITVYNGAVSGYTSSQELMKLVRDINVIKPHMVITYSGYNDLYQYAERKSQPFAVPLVERIFGKYAEENDECEIVTGCISKKTAIACDTWINNVKCMEAVARSYGCDFFACMQPYICTKKKQSEHEKYLFKMISTMYSDEMFVESDRYLKLSRKIQNKYSYIYNLTDIFGEADVYMDICHVSEKGNRIIAENVWNIIKRTIQSDFRFNI